MVHLRQPRGYGQTPAEKLYIEDAVDNGSSARTFYIGDDVEKCFWAGEEGAFEHDGLPSNSAFVDDRSLIAIRAVALLNQVFATARDDMHKTCMFFLYDGDCFSALGLSLLLLHNEYDFLRLDLHAELDLQFLFHYSPG